MPPNPLEANYLTRRSQFCGDEHLRRRNEIMLHVIRNEKNYYQRMKLNVRMFCAWLLGRG
jgi:hypothetical protein